MTDEKWKQKDGHAISSDVTDANPNAYADIGLLERTIVRLSHENDIMRGKLAQQQPDAELLEAANRLVCQIIAEGGHGYTVHGQVRILQQAIARAEQKGGV